MAKKVKPENQAGNIRHFRKPFSKDYALMEILGSVIMFVFIFLSNMGGLSGAGSNIPIILIFYSMDMKLAVPLSAFVAVTATVFRFILNFNMKHPNGPGRVVINYEVCEITMPFVFLGTFIGVELGHMMADYVQAIIFGVTVLWSVQTTIKKVISTRKAERAEDEKKSTLLDTP